MEYEPFWADFRIHRNTHVFQTPPYNILKSYIILHLLHLQETTTHYIASHRIASSDTCCPTPPQEVIRRRSEQVELDVRHRAELRRPSSGPQQVHTQEGREAQLHAGSEGPQALGLRRRCVQKYQQHGGEDGRDPDEDLGAE